MICWQIWRASTSAAVKIVQIAHLLCVTVLHNTLTGAVWHSVVKIVSNSSCWINMNTTVWSFCINLPASCFVFSLLVYPRALVPVASTQLAQPTQTGSVPYLGERQCTRFINMLTALTHTLQLFLRVPFAIKKEGWVSSQQKAARVNSCLCGSDTSDALVTNKLCSEATSSPLQDPAFNIK